MRRPRRRSRRAGAALLPSALLALLWLLRPAPALAHALLVTSDPPDLCSARLPPPLPAGDPRCRAGQLLAAPPGAVRLQFSEPVAPIGRGVTVLAPSGRAVGGPVRVEGATVSVAVSAGETGTYLVLWQVSSLDSHPTRGRFTFSVGRAGPPAGDVATGDVGAVAPPGLALQSIARWLHLLGFALGFGTLGWCLLVLRPLRLPAGPALEARLRPLLQAGLLLLIVAEPLAILGQTASLGPGQTFDPDTLAAVLTGGAGRLAGLRLGGALLLWVLLGAAPAGAPPLLLAAALGLALALVDSLGSHAVTSQPAGPALLLTAAHMAAGGAWLGGLLALLRLLPKLGREGGRGRLVRRSGRLAGGLVALLALSGGALAWLRLDRPADLLAGAYGRTLLLKAALALAALGAAALARRLPDCRWRIAWRLEATAIAAVLALAGLLASLPPPR